MIGNPTRPNIEKLTGELKVGKKIITNIKASQAMIENEILKTDIRVFISV
jgi:hypothetical protein